MCRGQDKRRQNSQYSSVIILLLVYTRLLTLVICVLCLVPCLLSCVLLFSCVLSCLVCLCLTLDTCNTLRARPFPPLHIMVSSQAISEETALCIWGNCLVRRVLYSFLLRAPSLFPSLVQCTSLRRLNAVAALQREAR